MVCGVGETVGKDRDVVIIAIAIEVTEEVQGRVLTLTIAATIVVIGVIMHMIVHFIEGEKGTISSNRILNHYIYNSMCIVYQYLLMFFLLLVT